MDKMQRKDKGETCISCWLRLYLTKRKEEKMKKFIVISKMIFYASMPFPKTVSLLTILGNHDCRISDEGLLVIHRQGYDGCPGCC